MKKTFSTLVLCICLLGLLSGCGAGATNTASSQSSAAVQGQYQKISPQQAKLRMDSGDPVVIVDVRTKEEYDAGHIAGAILIPLDSLTGEKPELLPRTDDEILVYCRSGNRSQTAAKKLIDIGYTNVYDFGGIIDWPYGTVFD